MGFRGWVSGRGFAWGLVQVSGLHLLTSTPPHPPPSPLPPHPPSRLLLTASSSNPSTAFAPHPHPHPHPHPPDLHRHFREYTYIQRLRKLYRFQRETFQKVCQNRLNGPVTYHVLVQKFQYLEYVFLKSAEPLRTRSICGFQLGPSETGLNQVSKLPLRTAVPALNVFFVLFVPIKSQVLKYSFL